MTSTLPLSSLRLFIPPLRLMTAAMWQVAQQQSIKHYMMLDDFVSLVTEAVPQLLTKRQRSLLLLALRAKVTLCDTDPLAAHAHLNKLHLVSEQPDEEGDERWVALLALSNKLTESLVDRHLLLQEVFNQTFDFALQSLISDFLYRIEQLFPVPDFRQVLAEFPDSTSTRAASWLDPAPGGLEDYLPEVDKKDLRELLTNHCCLQGQATALVGQDTEKILLSAWSHPLFTKLANPDSPATESEIQSDPLPCVVTPIHEGVEMVKVEMVVMTEEEQEEVDETVIGQTMSPVEHEVSTDSSAVGNEEHAVIVDVDSLKDSQGNAAVQSEGPVSQSHQSCSEDTSNPLHTISHISQRVAHKCPQCGKCFVYRSQVIRHLRTNKSCGSLSAKSGTVSLQLQPDHEEEPRPPESCLQEPRPCKTHTCFQCATGFETKADLLLHQRSHRTRIIYQCDQCDKEFHHLSSLSNHKQTHLERGKFTCSQSDRVIELVKKRDALRLQRRVATLTCTLCDKTFSAQTPLLQHLQTHSAEGAEPCYNCHFCDQTFSGVTQLRIHQRTHKFRTYQCDQCSKTYSSLTGLNSHRARHTNECRYLCPQCGKRFKTRDGLEGHLRTHTGERPYRCPYCPKDFTAVAGLNVHVRRHTGERPYVCTVCSKAWPSGGDLQKHMRTHTGERPYVCQECGKAFSISCHLTEHRRIHTGEKPYACPECGKCLRRKFDLKKHVLAHSKVRPYTCSYCPKSYTRKTHLSRHLQTHGAAGGEAAAEMADEV